MMLPEFSMAIFGLRWLALAATVRHNSPVAAPTAAGFDSPNVPRRMNRHLAGFFRPYAYVRLQWAGDGGEGKSPAGSLGRRSVNPAICPPTPFDSGRRVNHPSKEATMLATTPRTPAHPSPYLHGVNAARTWLESPRPCVSLHDWRAHHRAGAADPAAFDRGFADGVAYLFTEGGHHVA